jgi:uncharacterized membrane protein
MGQTVNQASNRSAAVKTPVLRHVRIQSADQKKKEELWKKMMEWGDRAGCHQMPERSFFYKGYQFPVCARCTGVMVGTLLAVPLFFKTGFHRIPVFLGLAAMWTDWVLQRAQVLESTNPRRLVTGVAGGFGVMSLQLAILRKMFLAMKK